MISTGFVFMALILPLYAGEYICTEPVRNLTGMALYKGLLTMVIKQCSRCEHKPSGHSLTSVVFSEKNSLENKKKDEYEKATTY